ncbi:MAG: thiolase family protein [Deltaproteobacteria bacterium]|nr:thiolase family protein [Deltaproteobacteria bacterium]
MEDVFVLSSVRTAVGNFQASLSSVPATRLGAAAIKAAVERSGVPKDTVEEVIMGNVLVGGEGQAPARQAALYAGLSEHVCCTQVGKVCGSGLKSVMMAAQAIACGDADVVVAGGMESMSNAPYALPAARGGMRMGNGSVEDLMIKDGLWDVYGQQHMGSYADKAAREKGVSREAQDDLALESYRRSGAALKNGEFKTEIVPVEVASKKGPASVAEDDEPKNDKLDKLRALKPAFNKDGTVTAGNASTINDGGAALVLASGRFVKANGLKPVARFVGQASGAQAPEWFTTAPIIAVKKVLGRLGLGPADVDYWEINEAFAVVTILALREFKLDFAKNVNLRGGAVSIGHPIGASGTRITTTLLHYMSDKKLARGLATACIGGGEAAALVLELV